MTSGLLVSCKHKIDLHKSILKKCPILKEKYKLYRNIYNSLIRLSKKIYFEQGLRKYKSNPKKTWELLNEITCRKAKKKGVTKIVSGDTTLSDPTQIANTLNNFFTNIGSQIADSVKETHVDPRLNMPQIDENIKFDIGSTGPGHVVDIIKSLPTKNSTDLLGLSTKMLKFISYEICTPLSHIFAMSLEQGIFPEMLKTSRTVPIFKTGDPCNVDNYRPISLVNTISKVIEKMVAIKLSNYLQINKLISPWQFGFQRKLSTEHNLINVTNYIGNAINNGEYCIGVFFDLKKAFDVVQHHILIPKLNKMGIEGNALNWFTSYLKNRKQVVDIEGSFSDEGDINCSVLQGSILGPILFLCFINDFPQSTILKTYMFADDTTCLFSGKNIDELVKLMNDEIHKIALWYRNNKMAINTSKTKYIIFHSKGRSVRQNIDLVYNLNDPGQHKNENIFKIDRIFTDNKIADQRHYKLLGVYFDENLTFNKHIENLSAKLSKSIFFLRRAKNFISTKALTALYHVLFHSHLLYCINITGCASKTSIEKISLLQKKQLELSQTLTTTNTATHFLQP